MTLARSFTCLVVPALCSGVSPIRVPLASLLFLFLSSFWVMHLRKQLYNYVGDPGGVPGFWLQPGWHQTVTVIWGEKQQMGNFLLSVCLFLCHPVKWINEYIRTCIFLKNSKTYIVLHKNINEIEKGATVINLRYGAPEGSEQLSCMGFLSYGIHCAKCITKVI